MKKSRADTLFRHVKNLQSFQETLQKHPFHWWDAYDLVDRAESAMRRAEKQDEESSQFRIWVRNADSPPLMFSCVFSVTAQGDITFVGTSERGDTVDRT